MIIERIKSNRDGLPLELAITLPEGAPMGAVQFLHGMAEHKERYYDFMHYLAGHGYICVIHDHRGHGASVRDSSHLGYFYTEDSSVIVDDAHQVTEYVKNKYGPLDLTLFGHSMGTLVAREYLKRYEDQINRVVLCGPPTENSVAGMALSLAKLSKPFYGEYSTNKLLNKLAIGPYNKKFKEKNEWLSTDPEVVSAYNADPLCGFGFTTNGFINLIKLMKSAYISKNWSPVNSQLPIFLMAGEEDPVIQSVEKFEALEEFLRAVGYENISSKLYRTMRHELLNEIGNEEVYGDVLEFLKVGK